jgi:hypothetical protein
LELKQNPINNKFRAGFLTCCIDAEDDISDRIDDAKFRGAFFACCIDAEDDISDRIDDASDEVEYSWWVCSA